MDTALVVAYISGAVALASAGFSGWTQLHVTSAGNAYLEVQTTARPLRLIDLHELPYDELRTRLQEPTARRDEINKTADIPSFHAYWRGRRNLGKGRQAYEVDESGGKRNG